jgi:hypothetical protein
LSKKNEIVFYQVDVVGDGVVVVAVDVVAVAVDFGRVVGVDGRQGLRGRLLGAAFRRSLPVQLALARLDRRT